MLKRVAPCGNAVKDLIEAEPANNSVHPGLLWVEAESAAVEEDGGFEVLSVSEATDSSLDGHDFTVHAFGDGVRDFVSAVTHDILQTFLDRSCDSFHRLEFCVNHSLVSVVEVSGC